MLNTWSGQSAINANEIVISGHSFWRLYGVLGKNRRLELVAQSQVQSRHFYSRRIFRPSSRRILKPFRAANVPQLLHDRRSPG